MTIIRALYERYKQDVYRYLLHLSGDVHLAEDLTSDTFLAALLALPRFRGESDVKTWLFAIARNKWREQLRRQKPSLSLEELEEPPGKDPAPEEAALRRQQTDRLQALLAMEPERTQRIVELRAQGYAFQEIAGRVGVSESSARVIDFRARKKLREIMEREGWRDD